MNTYNNQSNLFIERTFTTSNVDIKNSFVNSMINDKEKSKNRNNTKCIPYKLFIMLFFFFQYILIQCMFKSKNKVASELKLIKGHSRILYEGQPKDAKDFNSDKVIMLHSLDEDEHTKNEEDKTKENGDENELTLESSSYLTMLNFWRSKSYDFTDLITQMWFEWNCGRLTRGMDPDWKESRFESWFSTISLEVVKEDKKNLDDIKAMIRGGFSSDYIKEQFDQKRHEWEKRMEDIKRRWELFLKKAHDSWNRRRHNGTSAGDDSDYYNDSDDDYGRSGQSETEF